MKPAKAESTTLAYLGSTLLGTFLLLVFFSAGCARLSGGGGGHLFQIPWPDEKGRYQLQNVAIESYDNPSQLQGRYTKVFVTPGVNDRQFESPQPVGRYLRNRDGVYVPLDYISLQAAAIQAHYERLAKLDGEVAAAANWPARIALDMNITRDDGKRTTDNALFWDELDALLIPPYTGSDVPIAVNAGILAHEHFHMIFYSMVVRPLGPDGKLIGSTAKDFRRLHAMHLLDGASSAQQGQASSPGAGFSQEKVVVNYNALYLTALNEGLADFWGWVYTGDPAFIAASLPKEGERRRIDRVLEKQLDGKPELLAWVTDGGGKSLPAQQLMANAYAVGTTYSRALHELTRAVSGQKVVTRAARMAVAAAVIKTLPQFMEQMRRASAAKQLVSPNSFMIALYKNLPRSGDSRVCRTFRRVAASDWDNELAQVQCGGGQTPAAPAGPATPASKPAPKPGDQK